MERKFSKKEMDAAMKLSIEKSLAFYKSAEYKERIKAKGLPDQEIYKLLFGNLTPIQVKKRAEQVVKDIEIKKDQGFIECEKVFHNFYINAMHTQKWIVPYNADEFAGFYLYKFYTSDNEIVVDRHLFKEFNDFRQNEFSTATKKDGLTNKQLLFQLHKANGGRLTNEEIDKGVKEYNKTHHPVKSEKSVKNVYTEYVEIIEKKLKIK
ncbi:MAG: hypothetical protein H0V30_10005 [Chitinophagaceae bacterium]|nr:hypothetical protein [Chitinophagaceae bacterium]